MNEDIKVKEIDTIDQFIDYVIDDHRPGEFIAIKTSLSQVVINGLVAISRLKEFKFFEWYQAEDTKFILNFFLNTPIIEFDDRKAPS